MRIDEVFSSVHVLDIQYVHMQVWHFSLKQESLLGRRTSTAEYWDYFSLALFYDSVAATVMFLVDPV